MNKTWLGFDWGISWIGVACGQNITKTATPLRAIRAKAGIPNWHDIALLIEEWKPSALILGIPKNMDGTTSEMTVRAIKFGKRLHGRFCLPVHTVDERLTTREAFDSLGTEQFQSLNTAKHKEQLDSIAAQIILQSWLDNI